MDNLIPEAFSSAFPDEQACLDHLEMLRWNGIVTSPFSPNSKVYFCKDKKYKCRETGKYFNAKTNTLFHNSRISLQKWFIAIWLIAMERNKITSVELAKHLGITQKTAWYMIQRIIKFFGVRKTSVIKKTELWAKEIDDLDVVVDADRLRMIEWLNLLKK